MFCTWLIFSLPDLPIIILLCLTLGQMILLIKGESLDGKGLKA